MEKRRWVALWAIIFGGVAYTGISIYILWRLRAEESLYHMGLAANVQVLIMFSALAALLVRRQIKVGTEGIHIEDGDDQEDANNK